MLASTYVAMFHHRLSGLPTARCGAPSGGKLPFLLWKGNAPTLEEILSTRWKARGNSEDVARPYGSGLDLA